MNTMKRVLLVGAVCLLVATVVRADTAPSLRPNLQRARGGIGTASAIISGSAELITGVTVSCGGTACVASLYDSATLLTTTKANGVWEGGMPANQSVYVSFKDAPIRTTSGVSMVADANVNGVIVYTEQNVP